MIKKPESREIRKNILEGEVAIEDIVNIDPHVLINSESKKEIEKIIKEKTERWTWLYN